MIVRFVDIGGIVDQYCLNFLLSLKTNFQHFNGMNKLPFGNDECFVLDQQTELVFVILEY